MGKIYYKDQYIKSFVAELESVKEKEHKFHVVLDKTAFFPGIKEQFCDLGLIENEKVIDVYEDDGLIYHVLEKKPIKLHKLKCSIDWGRRRDSMDQHLGYHVLLGCFHEIFKFNTIGFHMERDICTMDIDGILDEDKIREVEKASNLIIGDDLKVEILTPDKKELKKLGIRNALSNTNKETRVIKIEDLYIDTCNGIHPNSTLELRMIKIISLEKIKNFTRIGFIAGRRAVDNSFAKDVFTSNICKYLKSSEDEAIKGIKYLNENLKETQDQNKKNIEKLAVFQVKEMIEQGEKLGNITVIKKIYEKEEDIKYASKVASKIVEKSNKVVLMAIKSEDRVNLIFTSSKDLNMISMNDLLKDSITLIDGNGGGSSYLAQGAGKNNNNLEATLDYAFNKIKQTL